MGNVSFLFSTKDQHIVNLILEKDEILLCYCLEDVNDYDHNYNNVNNLVGK